MHKAGIKEKAGPWFWKISNTYVWKQNPYAWR
jgi:hypothetical protein